ncbi:MAG: carboxymuconolactone decarboxylase family protein [Pseudorhodoplanes sp.]|uniref:carboxymuconolactone decarboxylase family protein n=1 Tax=Pseudorhodoplanes sp. TaxID=1934341 RepID=UPI003D0AB2DA
MARIEYADENRDPEVAALARRIRAERAGVMHNLYRMLLQSPPVAEGWLAFLTAIRQKCQLPGNYRELAILRIALLNRAQYEYEGHVPYALRAGVRQAQIDALENWQQSPEYDPVERIVLAYTESMTRQIQVPDDVFAKVKEAFPERQMVELTATIGAYNCVSRFLEAIRIDSDV